MVLGARMAAWAGGKKMPTARDYILDSVANDGFLEMWDAIENIAFGQHSNTASQWTGLISNGIITPNKNDRLLNNGSWGADSFIFSSSRLETQVHKTVQQIECVFTTKASGNQNIMTPAGYGSSLRMTVRDNNGIFVVPSNWANNNSGGIIPVAVKVSVSMTTGSVYVNGAIRETATASSWGWSYGSNAYGLIGSDGANFPTTPASISCIRLFSRIQTAEEIATRYAIDAARFNLPTA